MAVANKDSASSELSQILLLTLGMTGVGLMVLFLVLNYYMVPDKKAQAAAASREYKNLTDLLLSSDMQALRREAELKAEAGEGNKPQQDIIDDLFPNFRLEKDRFPGYTKERDGAQKQSVTFKPSDMGSVLRFIAEVRREKKTIEVAKLKFTTPSRSKTPGLYTASIDFIDYDPPSQD